MESVEQHQSENPQQQPAKTNEEQIRTIRREGVALWVQYQELRQAEGLDLGTLSEEVITEKLNKINEILMNEETHKNFIHTFPIVAKFIIFSNVFTVKSFKEFVDEYYSKKQKFGYAKTYEEFCKKQCLYYQIHYKNSMIEQNGKNLSKKISIDAINELAKKATARIEGELVKEFAQFKDICDRVQTTTKDERVEYKREKLKKFLLTKFDELASSSS
jgi:hypothetical protein